MLSMDTQSPSPLPPVAPFFPVSEDFDSFPLSWDLLEGGVWLLTTGDPRWSREVFRCPDLWGSAFLWCCREVFLLEGDAVWVSAILLGPWLGSGDGEFCNGSGEWGTGDWGWIWRFWTQETTGSGAGSSSARRAQCRCCIKTGKEYLRDHYWWNLWEREVVHFRTRESRSACLTCSLSAASDQVGSGSSPEASYPPPSSSTKTSCYMGN